MIKRILFAAFAAFVAVSCAVNENEPKAKHVFVIGEYA